MSEGTEGGESKRRWSPARRAAANARRDRRNAEARIEGEKPDLELVAEQVIGEAVDNMITLAGFAMPIAPYTAVTIAGVPGEREGEWIVRSRALMAGNVLLEHAKRNPRILRVVARFNLMFKNVELVEVVGSVVAAGAVDAKLVPPDATIVLPGGIEMPVLAPAIGDTIDYIAAQQAGAVPVEGTVVEKRADRGAAAGADEGTGIDEPSAEQRAEAARTRERIRQRDEHRAQNGGVEPTARREGQTIVGGGVEST